MNWCYSLSFVIYFTILLMGLTTITAHEALACEHKCRAGMSFTKGNAVDYKLAHMALGVTDTIP